MREAQEKQVQVVADLLTVAARLKLPMLKQKIARQAMRSPIL